MRTDAAVERRFYGDLAEWWPLISPLEECAEAAAYATTVLNSPSIPVAEVLELGSGGGHNAYYLKASFAMTLVDLSEGMLDASRRLNPQREHHRDAYGSVQVVHETHRTGLFGHDVWLRLLSSAGFDPSVLTEETSEERTPRAVFVGRR